MWFQKVWNIWNSQNWKMKQELAIGSVTTCEDPNLLLKIEDVVSQPRLHRGKHICHTSIGTTIIIHHLDFPIIGITWLKPKALILTYTLQAFFQFRNIPVTPTWLRTLSYHLRCWIVGAASWWLTGILRSFGSPRFITKYLLTIRQQIHGIIAWKKTTSMKPSTTISFNK